MCAPKVASWAHQRYPTENRCEADGWLWETHDAHFPEGHPSCRGRERPIWSQFWPIGSHPLRPDDSCRFKRLWRVTGARFSEGHQGSRGTRVRIRSHFWPTGGVLLAEGTSGHGDEFFCHTGNSASSQTPTAPNIRSTLWTGRGAAPEY
jgi:hypothetical protein